MTRKLQAILLAFGIAGIGQFANAQCVTVTCPASITVSTDAGQCDAVVNYPSPTDSNSCGTPATMTFNYTGALQTFTVPPGVTSINVDASGAQGGNITVNCTAPGGLGARIQGTIAVTPGEVITILVGQQGRSNGSDAGGGGGSYVVRTGNVPLIVAGGGGGASNNIGSCGSNLAGINATITTSGTASGNGLVAGGTNGNGGGASSGSGGGGGGFYTDGTPGTGLTGNNGKCFINGGAGGTGNNNDGGGYGGGGAGWFTGGNGGGGGGYSGGATSGSQPFTGGGGGGSFNAGTGQINSAGFQTGNGRVIITYTATAPTYINQLAGQASGSTFASGVHTLQFASTDSMGNADSCTFSITVVDSEAPVLACPPNDTVSNDAGTCQAVYTYGNGTSSDNCPGVTVSTLSGPASGGSFPQGVTTVTLEATDSAGNSTTCTFDVEVVVDDSSSQSVSICDGTSYTIGSSTYTQAGVYTDVLSNGGGCDSVVTTTITVEAPIDVTTTVNGGSISANATGATYQWFECTLVGFQIISGATSQSFTPPNSGDYGVIVTVGNCSDTSSCSVLVGMAGGNMDRMIQVYPNPTNGQVQLDLGGMAESVQVEIVDLTGKVLIHNVLDHVAQTQLDLSTVENGVYFIKVTLPEGQHITRLVKQD